MEDYINESAEMEEVAELPEDVESEEMQDVAEPAEAESETNEATTESTESNGRTPQDAAFAEQRRRIAELEERERTLASDNEAMMAALSRYFEGETAEELSINANAYAEQRDPDEVREEYERAKEFETLKSENQRLTDQLLDAEVDRLMREGLREVQEIDPSVKSLDDLGEGFAKFIGAGLSSREAYFAVKGMEMKDKVFAPDAIGKVADTKAERDYYTSEELDHLTDEEMEENWDKVMRSMSRL